VFFIMNDISYISKKTACTDLSKSSNSQLKRWNTITNKKKFNSSKERNKYFEKLGKRVNNQTFKEREKEIIAKLKNQTPEKSKPMKAKLETYDETYFFNKELKLLKIEEHYEKRSLTPTGYNGNFNNLYRVSFVLT
jgi:hypothetical protein